jgi:hypothetical protein
MGEESTKLDLFCGAITPSGKKNSTNKNPRKK